MYSLRSSLLFRSDFVIVLCMKICSRCNKRELPRRTNGRGFQSYCLVCQREFTKAHYANNKQYYKDKAQRHRKTIKAFINEAKNKPCADCGNTYPHYVMDFDHLSDKNFNISNGGLMVSRDQLEQEIAKCDVVCSNCHRQRTYQRIHGRLA